MRSSGSPILLRSCVILPDVTKRRHRVLLSIVLLAGCEQENQYAPPPKVTVVLPQRQEVTDYLEFTGS
jgi:hypothetical protein